ncbi:unnamed protein product [Discosporangium mesarthrocarpum]
MSTGGVINNPRLEIAESLLRDVEKVGESTTAPSQGESESEPRSGKRSSKWRTSSPQAALRSVAFDTATLKKVNTQMTPTWMPHATANKEQHKGHQDGTERIQSITDSQRKFAAQFSTSSTGEATGESTNKDKRPVGGRRWAVDHSEISGKSPESGQMRQYGQPTQEGVNSDQSHESGQFEQPQKSWEPSELQEGAACSTNRDGEEGEEASSSGRNEREKEQELEECAGKEEEVSKSKDLQEKDGAVEDKELGGDEQVPQENSSSPPMPKKGGGIVKGPWTKEEDQMVIDCIARNITKWSEIAERIEGRIGKQCRERWFNHLDPSLKKSSWSPEEDAILVEAQARYGNSWTKIAKLLPGRSENTVKNRWNSAARRKAKIRIPVTMGHGMPVQDHLELGGSGACATVMTPAMLHGHVAQPSMPLQLQGGGGMNQMGQVPPAQQQVQLALVQQPGGQFQYVMVPCNTIPASLPNAMPNTIPSTVPCAVPGALSSTMGVPHLHGLPMQAAPSMWGPLGQMPQGSPHPSLHARLPTMVGSLQIPPNPMGLQEGLVHQVQPTGPAGLLGFNQMPTQPTVGMGLSSLVQNQLPLQMHSTLQQAQHQKSMYHTNQHVAVQSSSGMVGDIGIKGKLPRGTQGLTSPCVGRDGSRGEGVGALGGALHTNNDGLSCSPSAVQKGEGNEGEEELSLSIFNLSLEQMFTGFPGEEDTDRAIPSAPPNGAKDASAVTATTPTTRQLQHQAQAARAGKLKGSRGQAAL